jgi:hypothetical protein
MKKTILSTLLVFSMIILIACSESIGANDYIVESNNIPLSEVNLSKSDIANVYFYPQTASYSLSWNVQELIETADLVVMGEVTGISFKVLDATTAFAPTEETKDTHRWLHTIYDVRVITTYKGRAADNLQIRVMGGAKDIYVEEQLKLIKEMRAWPEILEWPDEIRVEPNLPPLVTGEAYLFTLADYEAEGPTNIHPRQTIHSLNNPFEKQHHIHDNYRSSAFYSQNENDYGHPLISAYDIISEFGDEAWDAFWTKWQKDNPDWEERIDKSAVEKVLGERNNYN